MSKLITYRGGSMDGRTRRVRSLGEQKSVERYVWKEFDRTNKLTGKERHETYQLDRNTAEYTLRGTSEGKAIK